MELGKKKQLFADLDRLANYRIGKRKEGGGRSERRDSETKRGAMRDVMQLLSLSPLLAG